MKDQVVKLQEWWMGELQKLTEKVMAEESRRQERQGKKDRDKLADFRCEQDILDLYGWGGITEKQKDKLLDMWEKRESAVAESPLYRMKLDLLGELYREAKRTVEDQDKPADNMNGGRVQ